MKNEIFKAYKFRIYPTSVQSNKIEQTFGCVRFIWNKFVENFESYTSNDYDPSLTYKKIKDNPDFYWLSDVPSRALAEKELDFRNTKSQYFNKNVRQNLEE